jgi:hypothetical protein
VKKFTQAIIRAGVPFGLAMGVFFCLQTRQPGAMVGGVVGGIVSGLLFGVAIAMYQRRGERRLRKLGVSAGDMRPAQERTIALPADANAAMKKAKNALAVIRKIQSDSISENGNQVTARTGITWQSFGERISVEVQPTVAGSSVRISSRPKVATTTMDGGKGRENVELFAKAFME